MDRRVRIKPERTVETMVDMEPESDSTSAEWEIVGMLAGIDEFRNLSCVCTKTPVYVVYAHKVDSRFCWYSKSTWKYHLLFQNIQIPNNVRELGDWCFQGWANCLHCVTFGPLSSLERIGVSCFEQAIIENVSIPDGVHELCAQCFEFCKDLRRVTFGRSSSLERIGVACFARTNIDEVSIPESVRELGDSCFEYSSLRRLAFSSSSSLERISVGCFVGARIEEVSIHDGIRELCDQCFSRCWSLRRVIFGLFSSLKWIGNGCFAETSVEHMSIPDGVRELGDQCFAGCSDLRRVTFGSSSSLERIGAGCFARCGLVEFTIPRSVREIGGGAFAECALPGGIICNDGCRFRAFDGLVFSDDCATCCCSYGVLSSVCIPDRVRELCDWCFAGCSNLRRVTFGSSSSLERIFSGCKSLRQVTFGSSSSLERIGVGAFSAVVDADWSACSIEEISIPDSVRELCDRCFAGCSNLRRVTFGSSSSLERIGVKAFGAIFDRGCASTSRCKIEEISIPDSVRELCDQCFFGCSRLRHATFGSSSSLERIGSRCFEGCGLVEFAIPRSVRAIGGAAFAGCQFSDGVLCSKDCHFRVLDGLVFSDDYATCCFSYGVLSSVCIPDSVRELCDWCFCGCESLRQVTFGSSSSLARIGISCFSRTGLKEVNIPESVLELGDLCFTGCRGLRSVTFGSSSLLVRIGDGWIRSTHVYEASIPSGVHELCDKCFAGCKNLCRVTFGSSSSLERIGVRAFSATDSGIDRSPCAIEEISIPDCVRELCDECFAGCSRLRRVTFGSSSTLERIGVKAFGTVVDHKGYISMCRIEEISIPDSVRELCDQCFAGCSHLRRVTFGSSSTLERIGVQAFGTFVDDVCRTSWCRIEEISIPDSVRELCDQCFAGCSRLRRIIFGPGSSIERIGFQAFPRTLLHLQSD